MGQFYGHQTITKLFKSSSTQVQLPSGATIKLGGQAYTTTSNLTGSISGNGAGGLDVGSVAVSTLYYVYAVLSGGSPALVCSLSASAPSGFTSYRKVGALITDVTTVIFRAYFFGEINILNYTAEGTTGTTTFTMSPANWIASQSSPGGGRTTLVPAAGIFSVDPSAVASPTQASIGQHVYMEAVSATAITVRGSNATPALAAETGTVFVSKNGIDAVQPDWTLG